MAEDREILREVWEGRIPICISLAPEDCNTMTAPEPFYLLVPRISYFPLVLEKVKKNFLRSVDPSLQDCEMWLEYDGTPLKWHYPIGVLFDHMNDECNLPWNISAHFSNFPEQVLIRCNSSEVIESHFLAVIKEADTLKHRGTVMTRMQSKDHKQLWMGLCNDKFDQFWGINRKLMEESFKYIPFRIHQSLDPPIQKLIKPSSDDGRQGVLQDLLTDVLQDDLDSDTRVLIHGLDVPLDTPLQWLSEHLSYPDNFLHIALVKNR